MRAFGANQSVRDSCDLDHLSELQKPSYYYCDTLVHRYTLVGVKRESVAELDTTTGEVRTEMQRHTIEKKDTAEYHDT